MQQGAGDSPEVLELYKAGLDLVDIIVRQVARAVGRAADIDDLMGAGREGLFDAARKFDPTRGVPFRSYANYRVKGAVIDGVRRQAYVPRRAHERLAAVEASSAVSEGALKWAHAESTEKLAAGDAETRLKSHLAVMITAAAAACVTDAMGANCADDIPTPEEQLAQAEMADVIRRNIDALEPGEAGVVRAYYFENKSFTEIAEQCNFSKSWAARLHTQAMSRLTKLIKSSI